MRKPSILTRDIRLVSDAKFFETDINRKRTPTSITKMKEIFADKLSIQQNCHFFKLRFVLSQSTTYPFNRPVIAKWLVCAPYVFCSWFESTLKTFVFAFLQKILLIALCNKIIALIIKK